MSKENSNPAVGVILTLPAAGVRLDPLKLNDCETDAMPKVVVRLVMFGVADNDGPDAPHKFAIEELFLGKTERISKSELLLLVSVQPFVFL